MMGRRLAPQLTIVILLVILLASCATLSTSPDGTTVASTQDSTQNTLPSQGETLPAQATDGAKSTGKFCQIDFVRDCADEDAACQDTSDGAKCVPSTGPEDLPCVPKDCDPASEEFDTDQCKCIPKDQPAECGTPGDCKGPDISCVSSTREKKQTCDGNCGTEEKECSESERCVAGTGCTPLTELKDEDKCAEDSNCGEIKCLSDTQVERPLCKEGSCDKIQDACKSNEQCVDKIGCQLKQTIEEPEDKVVPPEDTVSEPEDQPVECTTAEKCGSPACEGSGTAILRTCDGGKCGDKKVPCTSSEECVDGQGCVAPEKKAEQIGQCTSSAQCPGSQAFTCPTLTSFLGIGCVPNSGGTSGTCGALSGNCPDNFVCSSTGCVVNPLLLVTATDTEIPFLPPQDTTPTTVPFIPGVQCTTAATCGDVFTCTSESTFSLRTCVNGFCAPPKIDECLLPLTCKPGGCEPSPPALKTFCQPFPQNINELGAQANAGQINFPIDSTVAAAASAMKLNPGVYNIEEIGSRGVFSSSTKVTVSSSAITVGLGPVGEAGKVSIQTSTLDSGLRRYFVECERRDVSTAELVSFLLPGISVTTADDTTNLVALVGNIGQNTLAGVQQSFIGAAAGVVTTGSNIGTTNLGTIGSAGSSQQTSAGTALAAGFGAVQQGIQNTLGGFTGGFVTVPPPPLPQQRAAGNTGTTSTPPPTAPQGPTQQQLGGLVQGLAAAASFGFF
jgi:hypothetical protein